MENVTMLSNIQNHKVTFDLKGSTFERETQVPNKFWLRSLNFKQVLKDNNFIEISKTFQSGLIRLDQLYCDNLLQTLKADSEFLRSHNLIDYSFLLIIETDKKDNSLLYHMGIIDYLVKWNCTKKAERLYKVIKNRSLSIDISAIKPSLYQQRFIKFMEKHVLQS